MLKRELKCGSTSETKLDTCAAFDEKLENGSERSLRSGLKDFSLNPSCRKPS